MTPPWAHRNSKACYKYCHGQGRNRASSQSTSYVIRVHQSGARDGHHYSSSTALQQRFLNLSEDKKNSCSTCLKNKTKQIPLPQPKPIKLKFPGEEGWYFIYLRSSPYDSFLAIFRSTALEVVANTEVKKKKRYNN